MKSKVTISLESFKNTLLKRLRLPYTNGDGVYLISRSLTSKVKVELPGIPGTPLLPYARCAGIVNLRSPPTDIPATPMSQPLMTSPAPSLKEKGLPFLFAKFQILESFKKI